MSTHGNSALHIAVINYQLNRVKDILQTPECDCDALNHRNETALFLCLKHNGTHELITTLINHGCDVNIPNKKGTTPLHLAVGRNTHFITGKLLEKGADINAKDLNNGCTPIFRAIGQGRLANLQEILKWHPNALDEIRNDNNETALIYGLTKFSNVKIISTLIDHSSDVNISDAKGHTALRYAILRKSNYIARKLLEKGADVNIKDHENHNNTPLHFWLEIGNLEGVYMLLYFNASVNEINDYETPPIFMCFVQPIKTDLIQMLLDYVVDLNEENYDGYTLLYLVLANNLEIALDVIERGADVNKLSNGYHNLNVALSHHRSYNILKVLWSRTDFKVFKASASYNIGRSIIGSFCRYSKLQNDEFLTYLYMILESPYLEDFLCKSKFPCKEESILDDIIYRRELSLDQRLELISVFLSYGINIYLTDIFCLYHKYGFDECLELILMNGCCIHINKTHYLTVNPIVSRICYDIYEFYRTAPDDDAGFSHVKRENSPNDKVISLLELCRDLIRKIIFKKWSKPYSFRVYEALAKLPVPSPIKDILFLKNPIYCNSNHLFNYTNF